MKKIGLTFGMVLFVIGLYGQDVGSGVIIGEASMTFKQKEEEAKQVEGTPYMNDIYLDAVIKGYDKPLKLKYNAHADEMEFEIDGTHYHLKKELYPEIQLLNKKYRYTTYTEGKETLKGFLIFLKESSKFKLYKKEKIILVPAKKSTSSYDTSSPAKYKVQDPVYFMGINDEIVEIPRNDKKFAQLFGDQEKQVLDYIKSNKISLKNEQHLVKLFDFLSTIE